MVNNTTVAKTGKKNVIIITLGLEKKISIIIWITSSGYKLKPLIIFKGKKGKTIEKNYIIWIK